MDTLLVTTAIPFVNGAPHLGHALEYVEADVLARHARAHGGSVFLLTGTDEHAAKNVQAAGAAGRQFSYDVARRMGRGEGTLSASMVKAYVCRSAEWVTREAMQLHGGMGYAEEFPVSRYFVDARVLSIFEGADETLALKVIARRLIEAAAG